MVPRLHHGLLHIVRIRELPHAPDCPFHRDGHDENDEVMTTAGRDRALAPARSTWLTLSNRTTGSAMSVGDESARPAGTRRRPPPIAAVLFTALEELGYHRVRPDDVFSQRGQLPKGLMSRKPYDALRALDDRVIGDGAQGPLLGRDLICRFLPALPTFMAELPTKERLFPPGQRHQALFIGQVQGIERRGNQAALMWEGKAGEGRESVRVPVKGTLSRYGAGDDATGPYWCAAALGRVGDDPYQVQHAFVHPVYGKTLLLPVDGAHERAVAALLLEQIAYWKRAPRVSTAIELEKPLFETRDAEGRAGRPDFVLVLPDARRVVIEVMLGLGEDVRREKHNALPILRSLPNVVEVVVYDERSGSDAEFQRRLTALVLRLLNR